MSAPYHKGLSLRADRPWTCGFEGVCPAAYDAMEGRCVPHQLASVLKGTFDVEETNIDQLFDVIFDNLYPPNTEASPYEIEVEDRSIKYRTQRFVLSLQRRSSQKARHPRSKPLPRPWGPKS